MNTTKEIVIDAIGDKFHDFAIKDKDKKWYSEEEILKVINQLAKEEETGSVGWESALKRQDIYFKKDNKILSIVKVGNSNKYSVSVNDNKKQIHQKSYNDLNTAFVEAVIYMKKSK